MLEIGRYVERQLRLVIPPEPLLEERGVGDPPGPELRFPVIRKVMRMLPEQPAAKPLAGINVHRQAVQIVLPLVLDEIRLEIAGKIPRLLRRVGDVTAL